MVNQSSFAAQLLNLEAVSWTNFALWSLRSVLEEESNSQALACDVPVVADRMDQALRWSLFEEFEEPVDGAEDGTSAAGTSYYIREFSCETAGNSGISALAMLVRSRVEIYRRLLKGRRER